MARKYLLIFLILILFISCEDKQEIKEIRDHIKSCTADLIQAQLHEGIRQKEYEFEGQKFILKIDSTGKPVFFNGIKNILTIDLRKNENYYTIYIEDGLIKVR